MTDTENAVEKLSKLDISKIKDKQYGRAVADDIKTALISLCRQSEEFSHAVCMGGTIEDCINDTAQKITGKRHISDIDLYNIAAKFYFLSAVVDLSLTIRMSEFDKPAAESTDTAAESTGTAADLSMLIDW